MPNFTTELRKKNEVTRTNTTTAWTDREINRDPHWKEQSTQRRISISTDSLPSSQKAKGISFQNQRIFLDLTVRMLQQPLHFFFKCRKQITDKNVKPETPPYISTNIIKPTLCSRCTRLFNSISFNLGGTIRLVFSCSDRWRRGSGGSWGPTRALSGCH